MHSRHADPRKIHEAHALAFAVAVWFIVAGVCVVAANAWAGF